MARNRKHEYLSIEFSWAHRGKVVISKEELSERLALIPSDTRDTTSRMMGDPIPGDRRRELFPGEVNPAGWEGRRG